MSIILNMNTQNEMKRIIIIDEWPRDTQRTALPNDPSGLRY